MWQYNNQPIIHYGVKGMKWGVRRKQDELDRLAGRAYKLEELPNGDYKLLKGSKAHRVSMSPYSEKEGYAYISFRNADVKGYRREISEWLRESVGHDTKIFDMSLKVKDDILIPNEAVKVETFLDMYSSNRIDKTSLIKIYQSSKLNDPNNEIGLVGKPAKLSKKLMDIGFDKNTAGFYSIFSMAMYEDDKLKDSFFKELKSKGYDAVEDFEDSFSHREQPLIIFEREKKLQVTKLKPIPTWEEEGYKQMIKDGRDADDETEQFHEQKFTPTQ